MLLLQLTTEGKIVPETVLRLKNLEDERRRQLHSLLDQVISKGVANRNGLRKLHQTRELESQAKSQLVHSAKQEFKSQQFKSLTSISNASKSRDSHKSSSRAKSNSSSSSKSSSLNWFNKRVTTFNQHISRIF